MRAVVAALTLLLLASASASAQRIEGPDKPFMAAGLAENEVEVKVNYSGTRVVLFATAPQPENETSGLAVALIGPMARQTMIHRTASGAEEKIEFVTAPLVFAVGAEPQVARTVPEETMVEAGLNAQASAMPRSDQLMSPDLDAWRRAFVDLKMSQGLYSFGDTTIERLDGGLRRAKINLPLNAPPGEYRIRAVAFRNGQRVGETEQVLTLVRSGLDATLFDLSRQHGLIYGIVAVMIGAMVGGAAAWFGRK
jgi:uncharacterized protein (TIGR02186 family)